MAHGLTRRIEKSMAGVLALLLAASSVFAADEAGASVQPPVVVRSIIIKGGEVRVGLDGHASYQDFILSQPPRIVLQISNADYRIGQKNFPGQGGVLKDVRAGQFKTAPVPVARVVIDLSKAAAYRVMADGNDLLVSLAAQAALKTAARAAPTATEPAAVQAKAAPETAIMQSAREVVQTKPVKTPPAAQAAAAPSALTATDRAATPAAQAPSDADAGQGAPVDILSRLSKEKISLDFDQTDIHDVFQLFAAKAGINIIYGPDVQGQLTLHLNKVPFNEAFRTVLDMMNLTTVQVGDDILRVLTPSTLEKVQTEAATTTQIIPLNYSKAADLAATIQQIITAEKIPGEAISDSKTNSIIITASPSSMPQITQMVEQLDVRPKEVLIEAKLVEVSLNNSLGYGIQWNSFAQTINQHGSNIIGAPIGVATTNGTFSPSLLNNSINVNGSGSTSGGSTAFYPVGSAGQGTGVNIPAINPLTTLNPLGALTLGRITNNYILNLTLSAEAAAGKVKILSDPKIATLNNQPADIQVTTEIPYVTTTVVPGNTGSGSIVPQTVNYAKEGIELTVTPVINADGRITLTINPNISQPSATAASNTATGAPGIDTRSAQTTVMVKNGDTVVIGGLIHDAIATETNKIPLLGDIPILGWLFKSTSKVHTRNELLIFVTPNIMPD